MASSTKPVQMPTHGRKGSIVFIIILGLIIFTERIAGLITDWFWFQEVGYETVFTITLWAQIKTAVFFGVAFFIIFYTNLFISIRLSSGIRVVREDVINIPALQIDGRILHRIGLIVAVVFSFFAALSGANQWENYLRFQNVSSFGLEDPLFHKDIGFYVFKLPFLNYLYGWIMTAFFVTVAAAAFIYIIRRAFAFQPPRSWHVASEARMHLSILASLFFFAGIFGNWLALNEILYAKTGVVFGPGYTEVTTQLWVVKGLMVISFLCAISLLGFAFRLNWRFPAFAVLLFILLLVVGRNMYPSFVQKFRVVPNEILL
jgi:hypothetical protein